MGRMAVPAVRIRSLNTHDTRPDGLFVLYWMIAFRRTSSNFALQRAAELARSLQRPLVILESLRVDFPWASDRLQRFVIAGMAAQRSALAGKRVTYVPHVESHAGDGQHLFDDLASKCAAIVTDDYPAFFLPATVAAAAARVTVRLEAVDSNGLLPLRLTDRVFSTAFAFRAHVQRHLRSCLAEWPDEIDWDGLPPPAGLDLSNHAAVRPTPIAVLESPDDFIAALPIDHGVAPVDVRGGAVAGHERLTHFVKALLPRYIDDRNQPDIDGTSRLSPYLHFGHVSAHQVFTAVMTADRWTSRKLSPSGGGRREGWWGASPNAEAFLDQLITWREVGFNMCASLPDSYDRFDSLPGWARATLARHASDPRPRIYTREEFEQARTHDPVWNAAQRQLTRDGWMHNYLRMLWGKKILEWSETPEAALETMTAIMNRYALDGRDPNSYSGYAWTLGRYDRPWGPERPIFGTVRYMSSDNTVRKLKMKAYLKRYGQEAP
jgi:deoxyribodipyrimidine photo-lyase